MHRFVALETDGLSQCLCIVKDISDDDNTEVLTKEAMYPFEMNVSLCGGFINNYLIENMVSIKREWHVIFESHMKILKVFHEVLKSDAGSSMMKVVMENLKRDPDTINFVRLFQNGNHGRNCVMDFNVRVEDSFGLMLCILYFSRQNACKQM